MQKKFNEKYNDSCIKIFKVLQLLYEDKANYEDMIAIFTNSNEEKQHVILNKYLNTLKVFGIKISKKNNKYSMLNFPFADDFEDSDLKAISKIEKLVDLLPSSKFRNDVTELLSGIKFQFNDNTKRKYNKIYSDNTDNSEFFYSSIREQIEQCEKICQQNFKINIKYLFKHEEISSICNAKQVIYDSKIAYLQVYKIKEQEVLNIPINNILSIEQLPTQSSIEMPTTVVYRIKGRLAKAYCLKENERLGEVKPDGSIVIINNNEPYDVLLARLLRYDSECVIERPKFLRNKMLEIINDTLKNYE